MKVLALINGTLNYLDPNNNLGNAINDANDLKKMLNLNRNKKNREKSY
jgi:hypothetical protein